MRRADTPDAKNEAVLEVRPAEANRTGAYLQASAILPS